MRQTAVMAGASASDPPWAAWLVGDVGGRLSGPLPLSCRLSWPRPGLGCCWSCCCVASDEPLSLSEPPPPSGRGTLTLNNVCGTFIFAQCEELPGCVVFVQIRGECLSLHCGEPFVLSGPSL